MNYTMIIVSNCALYITLAIGMNVAYAWAGFFSLVQAAVMGFGAYAFAQALLHFSMPWPEGLLFAFGVGVVGAIVLGTMLARFTMDLAVITTLAFGEALNTVFSGWNSVTGGNAGLFGITMPSIFGVQYSDPAHFALYSVVLAAIVLAIVLFIRRSRAALLARAQAMEPSLLASLGLDPRVLRLIAFGFSGGITAIGGALFAQSAGYIDPSSFTITTAFTLIVIVVVGGTGNLFGTVLVAIVLTASPYLLSLIRGSAELTAQIQLMLSGVVLTVVILSTPRGIFGEGRYITGQRRRDSVASGQQASIVSAEPLIDSRGVETP